MKYGWLVSCRGPNGGIKLTKNAGDIRVMDIVSCIDGLKLFNNCILGLAGCNERHRGPLHVSWAGHRAEISKDFNHLKVKDLSGMITENPWYLTGVKNQLIK